MKTENILQRFSCISFLFKTPCLNLSQVKILYNFFILSQFNYCCLVWMFCGKTLQNNINQIQKRALRVVYNKPNLNQDKPVELDKSTAIHI